MKMIEALLWKNQCREYLLIRNDSKAEKEQFVKRYIDKDAHGYHEHIEVIHEYGYRGYLWEFSKKEGDSRRGTSLPVDRKAGDCVALL